MVKIVEQANGYALFDTAQGDAGSEEIAPLYPWSVLTAARRHDITTLEYLTYDVPRARGIENMVLGTDFIISE